LFRGSTPTVRSNNARLRHYQSTAEVLLLNLSVGGELVKMTSREVQERVQRELNLRESRGSGALLDDYLERTKVGKSERTKELIYYTQKRLLELVGRKRVADIDAKWCEEYRDKLETMYAAHTVRSDLARIGRAITLAVEDGHIPRNPMRAVRKPRAQVRKKALAVEQLRQLRDMQTNYKASAYARDIFMLQLYLIGINLKDLYAATSLTNGRLEYVRHKTKKLYSVKVEPEAMALIERLRGKDSLVDFSYSSYKAALGSVDNALSRLGVTDGLSTNWARHTWATIAAELEIPMETISHALGHQIGSPVTSIYIAVNQKKVDDANRRVIDYINGDINSEK
jgi:integrase